MERQEMDWKRLVQFALQGSSDLEQYAILLVRVSIGLFFAISGANKLFVAGGTKPVYETLVKAKVPFPHQTAYFVAGVEFIGGSLLTPGFLSSPACVALMIDMIVATLTTARLQTLTALFDAGRITARVGSILPLSEARRAHCMLAGAPHKSGKIVLQIGHQSQNLPARLV